MRMLEAIKLKNIFICSYNCLLNIVFRYDRPIGPMDRPFSNGSGDQGSIPGRVIPKTQNMVLDTSLLNTKHYKIQG